MADPTGHPLRLAELLADESFGLELLCGEDALAREVRGAHSVEVESPERWLGRGWIMLTTGVRLRGHTAEQRRLVAQLEASGACALGFGVGLSFKRVPPALLEAAEERGFPVFTVPYETPFREIIHFVESALAGREEQVFRRITALQRYLVDALRAPQPERALVERLARFLDAGVALASADGTPDVTAGRVPGPAVLRRICAQPPTLVELEAGDWHAVAAPVVTPADAAPRRLVIAVRRRRFVGKLVKPAAEATAPLLAAVARLGEVARDQEHAVKAALLLEALEPADARDPLPLAARAAAFGLDIAGPARLVVIRAAAGTDGAGDLRAVRQELVLRLERACVPHLAHNRDGSLMLLVQGADGEVEAALGDLAGDRPEVLIGIGRAVKAIGDAHHSLRDAELAVDRARLQPDRRVMRFEEFDIGTFMVSEVGSERIGPKVDEILSVLRANPPVHEAVSAYFAHDLDIAATAAALHIHRNSLRYRLARAEQLMGRSLKQPATIAGVYIALVAAAGENGAPVTRPKAAV
jgi:PucR family transcriptional regulator, purine catabolism regulatory protein